MANQITIVDAQQRFKKTPAGAIPVDWDAVQISYLCDIGPGKSEVSRLDRKIPVSFVRMENVQENGRGLTLTQERILGDVIEGGYTYFRNGDILYAKITPCLENGKVALATNLKNGIGFGSTEFHVLRPQKSKVVPDFLFHWLTHQPFRELAARHFRGSAGQQRVQRDFFGIAYIPLPPLAEQKKIAEILSLVDEAVERTRIIIEREEALLLTLIRHLVHRGLQGKKFKDTVIGSVPEHWRVVPLEQVADVERGKFQHRPRNEPRFYGGVYPFIQTGEVTASGGRIRTYSQTLNEEGLAISRLFPKGTILITIAANIGETAIAEFEVAFPDSLVGVVAKSAIDNRFLEYYLRTRKGHLNCMAPESAQKNINLETLRPYPVPLPPHTEQLAIADTLDAVSRKQEVEKTMLTKMISLRATLMGVLLTGKVRV